MKTLLKRLRRFIFMLSLLLVPAVCLGATTQLSGVHDNRACMRAMHTDLYRLLTDAYNLSGRTEGATRYIQQLVPYSDAMTDYGERRATLIVDCIDLEIERVSGWELF